MYGDKCLQLSSKNFAIANFQLLHNKTALMRFLVIPKFRKDIYYLNIIIE